MKIYLAIPYKFNPDLSHSIVCEVTAKLMQQGHTVFSPISHGHFVSDYLPDNLRTDSEWWMQHDLPFIDWCDALHVVCIGEEGAVLIEQSHGVQEEMKEAKRLGKPITIVSVNEPPAPEPMPEEKEDEDPVYSNINISLNTMDHFRDFDTAVAEAGAARKVQAIRKMGIDIVYASMRKIQESVNKV
jgi:hypothetical protein